MDLKLLALDIVVNTGIPVPELINMNTIGLFKKLTYTKGILTRVEYYTGFDGEDYDNLIAMDFFSQTYNGIIYTSETKTTYYYDPAGAIGYQTAFTTTFVTEESFDFAIRKRNNMLTQAKFYALTQLGFVNYDDLVASLPTQITQYLNGPYQPIVTELNALVGVKVYLTQPIADGIIAILTDF